jgi:hypothetical protein
MAESEGIIGLGSSFSRRTSAVGVVPKVFAEMGEAISITPPNPTRESADFTHLKSPNKTREHKPTLIEPGEANVNFHYTPACRTAVDTSFLSGLIEEFQIGYPDGATETFFGFFTGKATDPLEIDGKVTISAPIKITGLPVYAEPA